MSTGEWIRVVLFVSLVAGVYVMAAAVSLWHIGRRFRRNVLPATSHEMWLSRVILGFAAVGILCMAYGYFIEPYWLDISRIRIATPKLARGTTPIRIVHISDLHSDATARLEERLPTVIAGEKPDLIVFTGDTINSPEGLSVWKRCLGRIAAIAPMFVVKGNWDSRFWGKLDLFGGTGVRELDAEAVKVEIRGQELWVAGAGVPNGRGIREMLKEAPTGAFQLFLYHYPDEIEEVAREKVDLYFAGHTHGGQVALPFYGALVTLSKFEKRYEAGLYKVSDTWLYVNRGIGMEGGPAPRIRFWSRPEVGVIDIVPSG